MLVHHRRHRRLAFALALAGGMPGVAAAQQPTADHPVTVAPDSPAWRGGNGLGMATVHDNPTVKPGGHGAASVAALREAYLKAYNDGDADAMDVLYVDDAVRMPYDAPAQVGRATIVAGYRATFAARRMVPTLRFVVEGSLATGAQVVERGRYHEEMVPKSGGAHLVEEGKYVTVMARGRDGRWRFVWSIFNRDHR